ncbi:MAG TPA: exodeoxyribonuclease VII large subunit [Candidatus Binataceae bacterium]|nr:exodeoxyribonuclease VII large subunit [Candidatus Binataceae bacterium]
MAGQLDLALAKRSPESAGPAPLTVSELVRGVRAILDARVEDCWVSGEISNARIAPSGHFYFTLKDAEAAIGVVMFSTARRRMKFKPVDGIEVLVRGRVSIYETRGALQFYAQEIEPRGAGALQLAFEQLKKRLADEGLFDAARKRPLPFFPRTVGIVTALGGAGLHDMMRVLLERVPNLHVIVRPAAVQGARAAFEIAQAIEDLNRDGRAEVMIVGRGGGSLEDLWAFNEEIVARAIRKSRIPVVSAVGHEIDFTIADFAADKRAATPTFAGHIVVPAVADLRETIDALARSLHSGIENSLSELRGDIVRCAGRVRRPEKALRDARQRLDDSSMALVEVAEEKIGGLRREMYNAAIRLRAPSSMVREGRSALHVLADALSRTASRKTSDARTRFGASAAKLDSLSPLRVLERGYAVVTNARDGRSVLDASTVAVGDEIDVRLNRGRIRARTLRTEN